MTQRLLLYSRQEIAAPQVLDANTLMLRLHPLLQRLAGDDVELMLLPDSAPCFVRIDPRLFEQALLDLVGDVRAGLPGGGTIFVESQRFEASGVHVPDEPTVRFTVRSSAPTHQRDGVDRAAVTLEIDELRSAVAQSVAEGAGGKLSTERRADGGAIATLSLPLERVQIDRPSSMRPHPVVASSGCATSVLVVEDEPAVREFAAQALEAFGYSVLRSANGEEALATLDQQAAHVDLVLTDVVMPRMGGVELASRIRDLGLDVGVLYMSGYTGDSEFRHAVASRDVDFIAKPFSAADLAEHVRAAIAARRAPRIPDCLRAAAG